jgi:hypothetical protein
VTRSAGSPGIPVHSRRRGADAPRCLRDGKSELNYAIYHDRYQRTPDGWKFAERVYEVRYLDHTPLPGSVPQAAAVSQIQVTANTGTSAEAATTARVSAASANP